jgi:2-dehydro-3-deoxygalactonokinase
VTGVRAPQVDWIAADWGTTHLRVTGVHDGAIVAQAQSDDGMGVLARDGFEPALLKLVEGWLSPSGTDVLACGMVGSRQGWAEAPYRAVPCSPLDGAGLVRAPARDTRLRVWLVPGLMQARPADVMRGEETQIAGFLALWPQFDGVLCLPGTHSKWVHVSAGEIVSFQTFMTGEIFGLLETRSVLRHGLAGWDSTAFDAAVSEALSHPERLASRLFSIRAEGLIAGLSPAAARARLSGLLIGAELAAARPYWLGQAVAVIGADAVADAYRRALSAQGVSAEAHDATALSLAGLSQARALSRAAATAGH